MVIWDRCPLGLSLSEIIAGMSRWRASTFWYFHSVIACSGNIMILQKLGCETARTSTERPWESILFSHGTSFRKFFPGALITRMGILGSSYVLKEFSPQSSYLKRSGQPFHDSSRTQAFISEDQIVWWGIDGVQAKWRRMGPERYGITSGLCQYFAKMKRHRQEWWGPY